MISEKYLMNIPAQYTMRNKIESPILRKHDECQLLAESNGQADIVDFKLSKICERLQNYFLEYKDKTIVGMSVIDVEKRPFSTIVYIRIKGKKVSATYVLKSVNHHPEIIETTKLENQALVEYNILSNLYSTFSGSNEFNVPKPILVVPEHEAYVMEYVTGHLLSSDFRYVKPFSSKNNYQTLRRNYNQIGKWLRVFQDATAQQPKSEDGLRNITRRCKQRLRDIEKLHVPILDKNFIKVANVLIQKQLRDLSGNYIPICGRHGDFGAWNVISREEGITVIDFMGYQEDPVSVDIVKMLLNIYEDKLYPSYSARRVERLKQEFIKGFGPLPKIPRALAVLTEAMHRICSIQGAITNKRGSPLHKIWKYRCLRSNLKWFRETNNNEILWPNDALLSK